MLCLFSTAHVACNNAQHVSDRFQPSIFSPILGYMNTESFFLSNRASGLAYRTLLLHLPTKTHWPYCPFPGLVLVGGGVPIESRLFYPINNSQSSQMTELPCCCPVKNTNSSSSVISYFLHSVLNVSWGKSSWALGSDWANPPAWQGGHDRPGGLRHPSPRRISAYAGPE